MVADTMVMLDLLQEAGDEAVTLDELGVAGVHDPAAALLELELAGLEIQRVLVRSDRPDRPIECIRLAEPEPEQPTVELAAVMPRAALAPPSGRDPGARVAGLVVLTLLLALVAIIARRG
jgi:hypothetical protein